VFDEKKMGPQFVGGKLESKFLNYK